MWDQTLPVVESRRDAAFVHLNVDHWNRDRAARLLEAIGGARTVAEEGTAYRFLTSIARDDALELVRRKFGWTVASPSEPRSWLPGARPVAAASLPTSWRDSRLPPSAEVAR